MRRLRRRPSDAASDAARWLDAARGWAWYLTVLDVEREHDRVAFAAMSGRRLRRFARERERAGLVRGSLRQPYGRLVEALDALDAGRPYDGP